MTSSNEYLLVSNCGDFLKLLVQFFFFLSRNRSSLRNRLLNDCPIYMRFTSVKTSVFHSFQIRISAWTQVPTGFFVDFSVPGKCRNMQIGPRRLPSKFFFRFTIVRPFTDTRSEVYHKINHKTNLNVAPCGEVSSGNQHLNSKHRPSVSRPRC